jgi:predicted TIM-barrel fold metal-dependent hydrolase
LGPQVPDITEMIDVLERFPERTRGIGIPFGKTDEQVRELVDLQIRAGVSGLRVEAGEILRYPWLLDRLGEAGLWLYAINWVNHSELYPILLAWLERFPNCQMAAPHFLQSTGLPGDENARVIVAHPRFYAIFSSHGGAGGREPYPHPGLRAWAEETIALAGWDHILWGSEYPVIYRRSETFPSARDWLKNLLPDVPEDGLRKYQGETTDRLFFSEPPPAREPVQIPAWVEQQFDRDRKLPLFEAGPLQFPMAAYPPLHRRYVEAQQSEPDLSFNDFISRLLIAQTGE